MALPPLLQIAEGRRARPRRAPKILPREMALHLVVVDLLRKLGDPDWRWTHFPAGEARDVRTGAKLKRMGTARGWPDLIFVSPTGTFHGLELKREGEEPTEDQQAFRLWSIRHGLPHSVARSIEEATLVLTSWKCLRHVPRISGGAR